jgi:prepilin-type N-terminal cleavage/methylation domain-containing protein
MNRAAAGFTLVEVLLSVVIIGIITGVSLPIYESFVRRNDLDITTQNLAATLRRAETYAKAAAYDSVWGVKVETTRMVLFRGPVFTSRDTAYDEVIAIPGSITPSGLSEIQFAELTAAPSTTGSLSLTSTINDTRTLTINSKGMVSY